ncbi:MAG: response regulator transcription factor [Chitinophagaceae bacterium]|nr:response regulator transcription factor [Chitinophagaceae bacterium]
MEKPITRAVIIDDEQDGQNMIALLLAQFFPEVVLEGRAANVIQGIQLIKTLEPDLVFLDVEMPDGDAFDVLAACRDSPAQVILVTGHEHYSLKAIKASVIEYVLKPVGKEEFVAAVQKALACISRDQASRLSISNIYRHLVIKKVRIPTLTGFSLVSAEEIIRCEAAGSYTSIFLDGKKTITACKPLGEYEEELRLYGFVRIHRKHLINVQYIIEYHKGKSGGGYITLQGREVLEVSIRKKGELLQVIL